MLGTDNTSRLFDDSSKLCVPRYFGTVLVPITSFDVPAHANLWELMFLQDMLGYVLFLCTFHAQIYLACSVDCFADKHMCEHIFMRRRSPLADLTVNLKTTPNLRKK